MIHINVFQENQFTFAVDLNKKDARKFLKHFSGEVERFLDTEFDITITCDYPEGYTLEVFEYSNKKGEALKRAFSLMEGDI